MARLPGLAQDLRSGWRGLRRYPGFVATAVLCLGMGIGANTAVYSLFEAVYLWQPPFPDANRIVRIVSTDPHGEIVSYNPVWAGDVAAFRDQSGAFEHLASFDARAANFSDDAEAAHVEIMRVSTDFFQVFQSSAAQGRTFAPGEDQPGREHEAVLSHQFWQSTLGGANSIGRTIRLDGEAYTVIGIMPAGFAHGVYHADLWIPLELTPAELAYNRKSAFSLQAVGELRAGESVSAAATAIRTIVRRRAAVDPSQQRGWGETAVTMRRTYDTSAAGLESLFGASILLLVLACASVAGLVFERGTARSQEMAVRRALGASRPRLARQLVTEFGVIALAAGGLGVGIARALEPWMASLGTAPGDMHLDGRVLAFAALATLATALLAGLWPAMTNSAPERGPTPQHGRKWIVATQLALALVCVSGTGTLIAAVLHELQAPVGFQPQGIEQAHVTLAGLSYAGNAASIAAARRIQDAAAAVPGARSAALVSQSWDQPTVQARGRAEQSVRNGPPFRVREISPGYFSVLELPLREGRRFDRGDQMRTQPVAAISISAARRLFGNAGAAVGQYLRVERPDEPPWREVVAVVADASFSYGEDPGTQLNVYEPLAQRPQNGLTLLVREQPGARNLAGALRSSITRLDANLPLYDLRPMSAAMRDNIGGDPEYAEFLSGLDGVVLLLAAVGLFGLVAFSAVRRRRELAIRIALGSSPGAASRLLVWSAMRPALAGLAAGAVVAWLDSYVLANMVSGLATRSTLLLGGPALLLIAVALMAAWLPARRVLRLAASEVLKQQ